MDDDELDYGEAHRDALLTVADIFRQTASAVEGATTLEPPPTAQVALVVEITIALIRAAADLAAEQAERTRQ